VGAWAALAGSGQRRHRLQTRLTGTPGLLARLTRNLVEHARRATSEINELATEISALAERLAPSLLAIRRKASGDNGR
jgi:hypothetical protein